MKGLFILYLCNMNLFSRFILSLLLLCSHAGFGYTIHYCKGSVAFVASIFSNEQGCSSSCHPETATPIQCCNMHQAETEDSCCTDQLIQVDTDDLGEYGLQKVHFSACTYRTEHSFIHVSEIQIQRHYFTSVVQTHGPPLYKLFQQFLFYDLV